MRNDPDLWKHFIYTCDRCRKSISLMSPVIIEGEQHFCSPECYEEKDDNGPRIHTNGTPWWLRNN